MNVTFWQNMPTHHQSACIRALAEHPQNTVRVCIEGPIPHWRTATGWTAPDYGRAEVEMGMLSDTPSRGVLSADPKTIHIFSGIGAYPGVHKALDLASRAHLRVGVMSETDAQKTGFSIFRFLKARLYAERYRNSVDFILAIGANAPAWFVSAGFRSSRVFPYGYFVDGAGPCDGPGSDRDGRVRLIFVGRLVKAKGTDFLLRALGRLKGAKWQLTIIGAGPESDRLHALRDELGLRERVIFLGALPNAVAVRVIQESDVLVLPSRGDGWGAVINEALCAGVPVLCSDRCGARTLVHSSLQGEVFGANCSDALCAALIRWTRAPVQPAHRIRLATWAKALSGASAANYLAGILHHVYDGAPRPEVPWSVR